ncbi:HEPACAM family member 2 [Cottoperca gobio]|uniref:HEPACAM family member 2 n=1 Tax=Cottoperca gobio TaxID=56716 RepID=A0A6J2RFX0_COTGO|nr:HEPACAM family member 2-like [Cottoperca gobio]
MRQPLLLLRLSLAVLLSANVLAQEQVQIQFQTDPVLVPTGSEIVFTVLTVSQIFSMKWQFQVTVTVGQWTSGTPAVNPGTQFEGRVTITANQLRIGGAQLRDAGDYTVEVTPDATTGLATNSRSIQLRVFDTVAGVSMVVPSVAVEGRNLSLMCRWTAGTDITVQWGKGGATVTNDSRITVSGGSLVINPATRGDAGDYSCTVSNLVSAQTATQRITVYYGPDTPVLTKETPKECVGGGDVLVGQEVRLTCMSDSLPPALFSWQRDGQTVASGQPDSGVLSVQTFSTDESGRYVCTARNRITGGTSVQGTDLAIVDTCLNVGEVVGIVIGCLLLLLIIALLIVLIVFLIRRRRAQRQSDATLLVQKTNPNPRPIPADPQTNGARDLGQGPHPPLYHVNTHTRHPDRLYTAPHESRGNPQTLPLNGLHYSDTHQHNGRTHTNGLLHNASQNANSYPHNGIDNRAFTHTDAQNANTLPEYSAAKS